MPTKKTTTKTTTTPIKRGPTLEEKVLKKVHAGFHRAAKRIRANKNLDPDFRSDFSDLLIEVASSVCEECDPPGDPGPPDPPN